MRRRVTAKEVAKRAGVSLTTVSFVLSGQTERAISEETRERVLSTAVELGYRPNGLVRSLVRGKTLTIGVIVPRLDSSFHAAIVQGIQEVCIERDYRILLADSQHRFEREKKQVDLLLEHRVDGLISVALADDVSGSEEKDWLDKLVAEGIVMVVIDDHSCAEAVDCVVSDDFRGAQLAVNHLIQLGHRRIAHLSAGEGMSSARDRRAGYAAALQAAGIPIDTRLITGTSYFMTIAELTAAISEIFVVPERPTALFAVNDDMAAEAVIVARQFGLQVPADLAVVGYGNTEVGRHLGLTTIHQDPLEMGRRAALRLFSRLDEPDMEAECQVLPVHLIVRDSCGARQAPLPELGSGRR
jgi:DNA-binding LacI/PurR family transcriptional regulator